MGDLALLWFSIGTKSSTIFTSEFTDSRVLVAVIAGTLLPHLSRRDQKLLAQDGDEDEDVEMARLRRMVQEWRAEAARKGEPLRLPRMPFMLRNIWMAAMILFTVLTFSTAFITTLTQGIIMVSLVGICWAVACWVPFAIIMEASLFTFTFILKLSSKLLPRISSLKSLALMPNPRLLIPRLSEVLIVVTLVITSATYPHPLSIGGDGQTSAHPSYDDTL